MNDAAGLGPRLCTCGSGTEFRSEIGKRVPAGEYLVGYDVFLDAVQSRAARPKYNGGNPGTSKDCGIRPETHSRLSHAMTSCRHGLADSISKRMSFGYLVRLATEHQAG